MKIVGVGILGVGSHAMHKALPALAACEELRIVGLYTRSNIVREEQAARWGCKPYASAWAMLEDPDVDVVYVSTPTGVHATWAREILSARKHLWCEKSLASREEDWVAILAQAKRAELALCEAFAFPHHEQFCRLQEILFSGEIGRLCALDARFGYPHLDPGNVRYSSQLGGGALFDAGCYPLAAARLILGRRPTHIHAILEKQEGYQVDTSGSALLRYCDGIHAHLQWGFGRAYRNEIELWGENGTLLVNCAFTKPPSLTARLIVSSTGKTVREETFEHGNQLISMFSNFKRAVCETEWREHYWNEADAQRELLFSLWRDGSSAHREFHSTKPETETACA